MKFCCSGEIERWATLMRHLRFALAAATTMLATAVSANAGPSADLTVTVVPAAALLPPDRDVSANWKMAGLLSLGGIPNRTTQCGSTLAPLGGGSNDAPAIQTAINNCPAGQVVQLAAGNFTIAEGSYILLNKGITLRGAGAGSTILARPQGPGSFSNQSACSSSGAWGATKGCSNPGNNPTQAIIISPVGRYIGNSTTGCALTADGAQGATTITVTAGCASNFSAGQIVLLDELTGAGWQTDVEYPGKQIWASPDYRVVTHIHNPTVSGDDCTTIPPTPSNCSVLGTTFTVHSDSLTNEIKRVASVSGNTITFDSPLTISYRTSHTAQLWSFATPFVQQAGLENLTVSNPDNNGIEWDWCAFCWAKNVELSNWLGRGFELQTSFRVQLEGVYVHDGAWCVPGSGGYNIALDYGTSEALIEDSISIRCNKVMVARASGAGSVVGYNYMDMGYIAGTSGWVEIGLNASHLVGSHHVLFEGNWGFNADSDNTHGASNYMTYFRNWITGIRQPFTGEDGVARNDSANNCNGSGLGPLRVMSPHLYAWWWSGIGNVLGTSGCTIPANGWRLKGSYANNLNIHMYGWDDENGSNSSFTDPNVTTIYPAVGPNCPSASNCSTIDNGNWIEWLSSSGAATQFSPHSNITLSNGNRTATNGTTTGSDIQVNGTVAATGITQPVYYEMGCTAQNGNLGGGFANSPGQTTYLGQDANSAGFFNFNKYFQSGNGTLNANAWDGCVSGDTMGIMLDPTHSPLQIYVRVMHGGTWNANWNNTPESQPATGGYNITAANLTAAGTLVPTLDVKATGEAGTICGNAACGASPSGLPTGAVWWDTVQSFSQTPPSGLPNSFYLSSKPAFFSAGSGYPWPWVTPENGPTTPIQYGPSGCGGTCSGLPAKARWENGTPFTQP